MYCIKKQSFKLVIGDCIGCNLIGVGFYALLYDIKYLFFPFNIVHHIHAFNIVWALKIIYQLIVIFYFSTYPLFSVSCEKWIYSLFNVNCIFFDFNRDLKINLSSSSYYSPISFLKNANKEYVFCHYTISIVFFTFVEPHDGTWIVKCSKIRIQIEIFIFMVFINLKLFACAWHNIWTMITCASWICCRTPPCVCGPGCLN